MNREGYFLTKNILALFIDKLLAFPLWVKQVIFLRLNQDLASSLSDDFISRQEDSLFHLYVPILTFAGRTELIEKKDGLDNNIYNFLSSVADGLSILEISMNNFWTLEEIAKYFIFCLEQNYIKTPDSVQVHAMAGFMAGKFRTGEYFKRVGKINVDQLERTIIKQKEYAENGTPMKVAEVMISLGYITEKDTSSLLIIKEEAKKRFILDSGIVPKESTDAPVDTVHFQEEIAKLTEQNNMLKDRLSKILAFIKKNG